MDWKAFLQDMENNELQNNINMESLIELKARAYDEAVQVTAWQNKLNKTTDEIKNYVSPLKPMENGTDVTNNERDRLSTAE